MTSFTNYNVTIAILKGSINETVGSMMPSRAVRMSPRLAKKRNSQLNVSSGLPPMTTLRSQRKENTTAMAVPAAIGEGRSVTTSNQQLCIPTTSCSRGASGRGRRSTTSSMGVATRRASRRGSSKCNHSSAETCNHCVQR